MSLSTKLLEAKHLFQRFSVYTMFTQQVQLGHTNNNTKNALCSFQVSLCAESIIILRSVSILRVPTLQTRSHILAV